MLQLTKMIQDADLTDVELITKIVQTSFFDDATPEDTRKTIWLLEHYTNMIDLISNYEFVLKEENEGLNEYDMSGAEGRMKRLDTADTISNVTANTVIMMDQRHDNYLLYKKITNRVQYAINNIRDPHQGLVAKLLFLDGMKYLKAQNYMKAGYRKDIYPISETTFADKRRRAVANIANSLLIHRTLDFVIIDYGRGRNKAGEIGLRLPSLD